VLKSARAVATRAGCGPIEIAVTIDIDRTNRDNGRQDAEARVVAPSRPVGHLGLDATAGDGARQNNLVYKV
jgi:hypothetical protein